MLTEKSKTMMKKAFEKSTYRFGKIPERIFGSGFGVYIHVPFCKTLCSFCPFYKERFDKAKKDAYLSAIRREIRQTKLSSACSWLYIGGGTPNVLSVPELESMLGQFHRELLPHSIGIELLPSLASPGYLHSLAAIGFTKISLGIESFQENTLRESGRNPVAREHIRDLLQQARQLRLWSNVDMMVGLQGQNKDSFIDDMENLASLSPSQVTIYPYMVLRNSAGKPSMGNHEQFSLIEEAGRILLNKGYERKGVWAWGKGADIYDSSRDELVTDYAGFGPTAFSTYGNWKVVNPELDVYVDMFSRDSAEILGFVGAKTKATDDWRSFARMVYDLECRRMKGAPLYINIYVTILQLLGYARKGMLTSKGVNFAHEITKTVVEALPFPIQNPSVVENHHAYREYTAKLASAPGRNRQEAPVS